MRCIADVFLKQKAKCILKNVDILIRDEIVPYPKDIEEFEIVIDKFYQDFFFGHRNIDKALEEYTEIFLKYDVDSIVPKRMLLLIFENVVDYLDLIDNEKLFDWYYLVAKLILLNIALEEYSNSLTEEKIDYDDIIKIFEVKNKSIFDDEVKELFNENYIKIIKNITKEVKANKKCIRELNKSPLKVYYDIVGTLDKIDYKISRIHFDNEEFSGLDERHVYDAFIKYNFAIDFKYIEAESVSFEVIKEVFSGKHNTLYFIRLPNGFFRLRTNVTKLLNIIEPKTLNHFVFLVPYSEIISRDVKVKELRDAGVKIGVYHLNTLEQKSIKLKGLVEYVFLKPSEVTNYKSIIDFSRTINSIIVEENDNKTYKIYK